MVAWLVLLGFLVSLTSCLELDPSLENHRNDYELGHSGGGAESYFPQGFHHPRPEPYGYVDITYQDEPGFHPHHRRPPFRPYQEPFPWHWFALGKALFWKLKFLGLLKLALVFLVKLPVFLVLVALKLLFLVKLLKLAKLALALPLLIPLGLLLLVPLLPLLLAPLLLLPLLLPLLLLLPIPALQPPTPAPAAAAREDSPYYALTSLRSLLESDQCIERIACRIAPRNQSPYFAFIGWVLEKMGRLIKHPKFQAYVHAYKSAPVAGKSCAELYQCNSTYY